MTSIEPFFDQIASLNRKVFSQHGVTITNNRLLKPQADLLKPLDDGHRTLLGYRDSEHHCTGQKL